MKSEWKLYYTRASQIQDIEGTYLHALLEQGHVSEALLISRDKKLEGWYRESELNRYFRSLQRKTAGASWSSRKHIEAFFRASDKLLKSANVLSKVRYDKNETSSAYIGYVNSYKPFSIFLWMPWAITMVIEDWFIDELKKKCPN